MFIVSDSLGGCEMDWYEILLVQRFSHEAIIKKQIRKLGLLLHPDKNKFAGLEAAFKLIGEANAVLEDRGRHFRYDMKCRALLRTGEIPSAHQMKTYFSGNTVMLQEILRISLCHKSLYNQFADHSKLPNQISIKVPSNHDGAGNSLVKRIQAENTASNPVSKLEVAAHVDGASNTRKKYSEHGVAVRMESVEISESDSVKSNYSGTSGNLNQKEGNSIGYVGSFKNGNRARLDSEHVI
ncbi:hypothetical protein ACLB2K_064866 [Fragaria x ananassa]